MKKTKTEKVTAVCWRLPSAVVKQLAIESAQRGIPKRKLVTIALCRYLRMASEKAA